MIEQKKKKRTVPTLDICEEKKKLFKPFILGEKQHEFQICFLLLSFLYMQFLCQGDHRN